MQDDNLFLHLGRLEGKVDAILTNQTQMNKRLDEHDLRLGVLERYRSWQLGVSAAIAALAALLIEGFGWK
jgi:hypothetical protein